MNYRLSGVFTLRAPLSHIGEAISTTTYLVQEPILQPDGTLAEVFCYSGNAWRGQLRDLTAAYMLDHLGSARVGLDAFHLLFSGGRIGGEQQVDINRARAVRKAVPMLSLFGGGLGNMILPGKMRVANCYPVCDEARPVLPGLFFEGDAALPSYRGMTFEKSFSRKDDSKNPLLSDHMSDAAQTEQRADGPADQMRMTVELLAAGVRLHTEIDLLAVGEVELGCMVSALTSFAKSPYIGGQGNRGHGRVSLLYTLIDLDTGERRPFFATANDQSADLTEEAGQALLAYNDHLREQYHAALEGKQGEITALLGAQQTA